MTVDRRRVIAWTSIIAWLSICLPTAQADPGPKGGVGDEIPDEGDGGVVTEIDPLHEEPWCEDMTPCGVQDAGDCRYLFPPADAVEQHLADLGIVLDGDLSDALAAGAEDQIDLVNDEFGFPPGVTGDDESPRYVLGIPGAKDPNGFNVAFSLLFFEPDSDPIDGLDDSFLYIGWDVSDYSPVDGLAPRQFDADDNDSACRVALELQGILDDRSSENYIADLQACTDCPTAGLDDKNPCGIGAATDTIRATMLILDTDIPLRLAFGGASLTGVGFPTADNATNPTNACLDNELDFCGAGNNVELVIKRVETSGEFGPNGVATPDSENARQNRFALAQMLARLRAGSLGDDGDEEKANIVAFRSLPSIEATKLVRCAEGVSPLNCSDINTDGFGTSVDALPGAEVQYQITVRNTGNEDLDVTVTDTMGGFGSVTCDPVCETLECCLCREGTCVPIDPVSAPGLDLEQEFFVDLCAVPDAGFLGSIRNGESEHLGVLQGAQVFRQGTCSVSGAICTTDSNCPVGQTCGSYGCEFLDGDELVCQFNGTSDVGDPATFCDETNDPDCRNAIAVSGTVVGVPTSVVDDQAGTVPHDPTPATKDTDDEKKQGFDDNVVDVNLLCREVTFIKEVGLSTNGPWETGTDGLIVPNVPPDGAPPVKVFYRYSGVNNGEVAEDVTITDQFLCADIAATAAAFPAAFNATCSLCPSGSITINNVPANGGTYQVVCVLEFSTANGQAALEYFLARDDQAGHGACVDTENPDRCYRNCASVSAEPSDLTGICDTAPPIEIDSLATICNIPCEIEVTKRVVCVDNCEDRNIIGPWYDDSNDPMPVAPGSCVMFEIEVENKSATIPICALEFYDELTGIPGDIVPDFSSATLEVNIGAGWVACPPPICLQNSWVTDSDCNTNGNPCRWDPSTCPQLPNGELPPGGKVRIRFCACIPADANPGVPEPDNCAFVWGAGECGGAEPTWACEDISTVDLDIKSAGFDCLEKTWQFRWDENCNGVIADPDPPFSAATSALNLCDPANPITFPVLLKLCITVENTGEIPLKVTPTDPQLACVCAVPGVDCCTLPFDERLIPVGGTETWCCEILVPTADAMREIAATCDGVNDLTYENSVDVCAVVDGNPADICLPDEPTPICHEDDCSATITVPPPCSIEVTKEVKCQEDDDTTFGPDAEGLPGSTFTYRIEVCNTSTCVNIPQVCITDCLSCPTWFLPASVTAFVNGDDVTAEFASFVPDCTKRCFDFKGRPPGSPPWLAPGECLEIRFDVKAPPDFAQCGDDSDCTNYVILEGHTECIVFDPTPCTDTSADAIINVLVPDIACDKEVCHDVNTNDICDPGEPAAENVTCTPNPLDIEVEDADFPIYLHYVIDQHVPPPCDEVSVDPGTITICDEELVEDVKAAAGVSFGACDLNTNAADPDYGCAPAGTTTAECTVIIDTWEAWRDNFAPSDGTPDLCYENTSDITADTNIGADTCGTNGPVSDECTTAVRIRKPPRCTETKAKFDIWNENEVKLSGTERCLCEWDSQWLGLYNPPNHFLRTYLTTDKGKARIDGITSPVVCGDDSVDAPLLGISTTAVYFFSGKLEKATKELVGMGRQPGQIIYTPTEIPPPISPGTGEDGATGSGRDNAGLGKLNEGGGGQTAGAPAQENSALTDLPRATTVTKGSLLVFTKVEVKWNAAGQIIQDTFIDVTNDWEDDDPLTGPAGIQMYVADGDSCCDVWFDVGFTLSDNQPAYWSVATGAPKGFGPITDLGLPKPDPDPRNPGGTYLRGYVVLWAVDPVTGEEVQWNHLKGDALIVNYQEGYAWEYNAWTFQAIAGTGTGSPLLPPVGTLDLDDVEYAQPPSMLLLDFYATGATLTTVGASPVTVDTELTLWTPVKDFTER